MTESNSRTPIEITENDEIVLHVRDIRRSNYYVIDNVVMDEWLPLIGDIGYTIYSLLVRVSNRKEDESARVSFRLIKQHLGYSSATVMTYIRFLEMCQLIYRDRPEVLVDKGGEIVKKRIGNRSNTYYILEMHHVTSEELKTLKSLILADDQIDNGFRDSFIKRITNWKPISDLWSSYRKKQKKPIIAQPSLFQDNNQEGDDSPAPSVNPIAKRILETVNIREEKIATELSAYEPSMILAVIWHGRTETWVNPDRFSGYVIKTLRSGTIPPDGFITFTEQWLEWSKNQRKEFSGLQWAYLRSYRPAELAQELDMSDSVATSILALIKSESFSSFNNWIDIT